jgi:hypothetical protein
MKPLPVAKEHASFCLHGIGNRANLSPPDRDPPCQPNTLPTVTFMIGPKIWPIFTA